jgi:translocation and assembly module TamB
MIVAGSLAGLVLLAVVSALLIARTDWFHNMVRERIIRETADATGGRVEIGSFRFDWRVLQADVTDFVIHGREPAGAPPLFRARTVQVGLKIISVVKRKVDIAFLGINEPQVNVLVGLDGRTNLPEPKVKRESKDPVQTALDLAVGRFLVENGTLHVDSKKTPFDFRGENLHAHFDYELLGPRYRGEVSMKPLHVRWEGRRPVPLEIKLPLVLEGSHVEITKATLRTPESQVELTGAVENLLSPQGSARIKGGLALREWAPYFDLDIAPSRQNLDLDVSFGFRGDQVDLAAAKFGLGASRAEASGSLQSLHFQTSLAVGELGRLFRVPKRPEGTVDIAGQARFASAADYQVTGNVNAKKLAFDQGRTRLSGIGAVAALDANPRRIALERLKVSALGGNFAGRAAVERMETFEVAGNLSNLALRQLTRTYGAQPVVWDGLLSGAIRAAGAIKGDAVKAEAHLGIAPGNNGVPLTGRVNVNYDSRGDLLDLDSSYIATPATRVSFSGSIGNQIRIQLLSRDLNDLLPALALASADAPQTLPVVLKNGTAEFDGTIRGKVSDPIIAGRVSIASFVYRDQRFDRLIADVNVEKTSAVVRNAALRQGKMQAQAEGSVALREWKPDPNGPLTATASLAGAELVNLFALAGQKQVPVTGTLGASARVSGTIDDPAGTLDLTVNKGVAYDEPFDRVRAAVRYSTRLVEVTSADITAGPGRIDLKGAFEHPPKVFDAGQIRFQVAGNGLRLERVKNLQMRRPGLTGVLQLATSGVAAIQSVSGKPAVRLSDLQVNAAARGVELDRKRVGDLTATAETKGTDLAFRLQSDFSGSDIRGQGNCRLEGDYPLTAHVTVSPLKVTQEKFEAVVEGKFDVAGPALKPDLMKASVEIPKLELSSVAKDTQGRPAITLRNPEPIRLAYERSVVTVRSARLTGPSTDLAMTGRVSLAENHTADLRVKGGVGLAALHAYDHDVFASGSVSLDTAIRGPLNRPNIDGSVRLQNASLNQVDLPNGISEANGVITFNGTEAVIENMTAVTGGGKITLSGFVAYSGKETDFRLEATASKVRVRYPEGASILADASLNLSGSTSRSLLAGRVTILQVGFQPRTDFGSMLVKSTQPVETQSLRTGMLGGMQFDVQIETSPEVRFQTAMATDLQADANLRLRGAPSRPALLGRVDVTRGEIVFLGNKYTVNQGAVAFYNPQKIEPVLNVDLQTKAKGIDVILTLSGPIDKLQVTHRSDPPLQFSEIVSLLATGKSPTSDPALVAQQTTEPQQTWQQTGASYLVGQAIANPVAGRLQRLFGVSQLKFDPQITGAENTPQARLTLEQQVTPSLTFTYIQNVSQSNSQVVRIQWAMNKQWSAVALREDTGRLGLDFFYKKALK